MIIDEIYLKIQQKKYALIKLHPSAYMHYILMFLCLDFHKLFPL